MDAESVIAQAIGSMHTVRIRYHGKARILEPYLIGAYADERRFLLAWMVRCDEEPDKKPGWQHYLLSKMQSVDFLPDLFDGLRAGYNPVSDSRVRRIVCAVTVGNVAR